MVQFYYDYQSWLEEIHFSEHLEKTTQEVERYKATLCNSRVIFLKISTRFLNIKIVSYMIFASRYIKTTMVHFEDLREVTSKYLTEAVIYIESKYEIISSYPPVAFVGSLVKKAGVLTFKVIANPDVLGR